MKRSALIIAAITTLTMMASARADHPIVDRVADKVIQKYRSSRCEPLQQDETESAGQPKSASEQRAMRMLHHDAAMRTEFFNEMPASVVSEPFDCGMIP
jgi:hypothetical protein